MSPSMRSVVLPLCALALATPAFAASRKEELVRRHDEQEHSANIAMRIDSDASASLEDSATMTAPAAAPARLQQRWPGPATSLIDYGLAVTEEDLAAGRHPWRLPWFSSVGKNANASSCGSLCADGEPLSVPGNSHFFDMWRDCGAVCLTKVSNGSDADMKVEKGKWFDAIRKRVDCNRLLSSEHMDVEQETAHPPHHEDLPAKLLHLFTLDGEAHVQDYYFDSRYYGTKEDLQYSVHEWTPELIDGMVEKSKNRTLAGNYGVGDTNCLIDGIHDGLGGLSGKHVLVIGSESPWVEAICLAQGAEHVTTLEYAEIKSTHPRVSTITPEGMRQLVLKALKGEGKMPSFDTVVTFSSVEHSGLGRYGDALNPWGDLITMSRAWCLTKPSGGLVLGTMTAVELGGGGPGEADGLRWNADRVYGKVRYPHLAANWEQKRDFCGNQKVFVFEKLPPLA